MDGNGATLAEEFRQQCESWFTGEYRRVPTPFLYALFGVIHGRLQSGTFDALLDSPDFASLEAQLVSFPPALADQARALSDSLDTLALSTGAVLGGEEMLDVLDRVGREIRGLRGEASVSSSASRSVTTSARPVGAPQASARRQVTSGQFDVVSSSSVTSSQGDGAPHRPSGGIAVSSRSLRRESGESTATSAEVMDFGTGPQPSVRKEADVHTESMDFGTGPQPSVRKDSAPHTESMDFGVGPQQPATAPPKLAEPPFRSFGKLPPGARSDAASARHTSDDASPGDATQAPAAAPAGGALPLPPSRRSPSAGGAPSAPKSSAPGPATVHGAPAVPPPHRPGGTGPSPAIPPPSARPAAGTAAPSSVPAPPAVQRPGGSGVAPDAPPLSPPIRPAPPMPAVAPLPPPAEKKAAIAPAPPHQRSDDDPDDDPRSSTAPTSRRLDSPGASQPTAAMAAFRPDEDIPRPAGDPRLSPRLVPSAPSTSGAFATVGSAPPTGGRRPTISGAFMALDSAAEHPDKADATPPPSSWPRSLDAWISQPPADLLWNHESTEDSTESTLSRLVGLAHSAPIVGVEIQGAERVWTLWVAEGSVVAFHATPADGLPDLVELLLRNRSIDDEQARELKSRARSSGKRQRTVIAELRFLPHTKLDKAHRAHLRTLLAAMLGSTLKHIRAVGFAEFSPPDDAVGVSVLGVLHRALLKASRELPSAELRRRLERRRQYYPVFRAPDGFNIKRLALDERELELVTELLSGEHSLDRVLAMSTVNAPATLAILHTLDTLGLIGWVSRRADDLWTESTRDKLRDRQNAWRSADAFTILGTHWSAYDEAILRAWSDMRRRLDIERALKAQDEELRSLAREIDQQLLRARDAVADHAGRERVRMKLVDRSRREGAILLSLEQANLALFQEDAARVRDACSRILELSPGHVEALKMLKKI